MAWRWLALALLGTAPELWGQAKKPPEPRVFSVFPPGGRQGGRFQAAIRGVSLEGARAVEFAGRGVQASVIRVEPEPVPAGEPPPATPVDVVQVEVTVAPESTLGAHSFRVVTARGVTNSIALRVVAEQVIGEDAAGELSRFPMVVNGRIGRKGETDDFWVKVREGQTLTMEAAAFDKSFDPSVMLLEPSGSWFDPKRLNRIAFNDEPLYYPELSTDARLTHRFEKAGRYCVRVSAFSGQGGPDYAYQLRIVEGAPPPPDLHPKSKEEWEERRFTRRLSPDWPARVAARGAAPKVETPEVYRAATGGDGSTPVMKIPGIVEGAIARPGETHAIRLTVDKPQDLAIEVETAEATLPRFNPVVRLLEAGGREVVTNVYTKLNNCGGYMMKMIQAKTTFSLQAAGEYKLEIRDITTGRGGPDFAYRVLVRPQIPHAGKVEMTEDRVNLEPGQTKPLTLSLEREEEFAGFIAVSAEGLPAGVSAMTGAENPVEKPPLMNGGKVERYISRPQTSVLLLVASPDAPPTEMPVTIRVVARPVVDGRLMDPVSVRQVPVMVAGRRPS
ncbi:MAG: hypothetical protein HYR60_01650 [Acidobacteria bacterium]|nr:hypothetical protein [Acidobacteriota bacterium]